MNLRFSVLAIALAVLSTAAMAAIPILPGHSYAFEGFLVTRLGNADVNPNGPVILPAPATRVYLSAYPNGEAPPHVMGRQDILLSSGTFTQNLLTLARNVGPTVRVHVTGIGAPGNRLAVSSCSVAFGPPPPRP